MRGPAGKVLTLALGTAVLGCGQDLSSPTEPNPAAELVTAAQVLSFRQVSAGNRHSCGVTVDDRAYCWGDGGGVLGDGTNAQSLTPVPVQGGLQFLQVSVASSHSCGLTRENRAYCWGNNTYGQLGDGTGQGDPDAMFGAFRLRPVAVAGGLRFRQLRAGGFHTCGVTAANVAYCWGRNFDGAVGDGTTTNRLSPVRVAGGLSFRQVVPGVFHTCGATTGNRAYCWGQNTEGQLGIGIFGRRNGRLTPVAVSGGHSFAQVLGGGSHSCGLTTTNRVYCWGSNAFGQAGDGTTTRRARPAATVGGLQFRWVSPGGDHTCGTTLENRAFCWGRNARGNLGDGTTTNRIRPTRVVGGLQFAMISAASWWVTCGVTPGGRAYCWGDNVWGQLGDGGSTNLRLRPYPVANPM
jgi:alpha-tubulin suppressor-like RCC1 family protein